MKTVRRNGWIFNVATFCPACGSQRIKRPGWFVDGEMLMTECTDCGCHFGTAGHWTPDEERSPE